MTPRDAIGRMLDADEDLALYCARAIKRYEGWNITDREALHRLSKAVRGAVGRHFEIDWYPVLQDIFVRHDVPDMVSPLTYDARRDAEYRLRQEQRDRPMRVVRPQGTARHRSTG